jgi:predicted N-acetyltransferase YhbS
MFTLRHERPADIPARETLLDQAFGETRYRKTSERLRVSRLPAEGLALVATDGERLVGTARLWNIMCGRGQPALLLGPVAVAEDCRNRGIGAALVWRATAEARRRSHSAVILVGDASYYSRFGFSSEKTGALKLPGPFERHRLLALEFVPGVLDGVCGRIRATGVPALMPEIATKAAQGRRAQYRQGAYAA